MLLIISFVLLGVMIVYIVEKEIINKPKTKVVTEYWHINF